MKVGLIACSNGLRPEESGQTDALIRCLSAAGREAVCAPHLYAHGDCPAAGSAQARARDLMAFYRDPEIGEIYDVSGGDMANEILPFLDYEVIDAAGKPFWGYSDLTTVINAIYAKTGRPSVLYQIRSLVWDKGEMQSARFRDYVRGDKDALFGVSCEFLQGETMEGVLVGGNVRCFLKLAGTPYFPDMNGKILLLEALGGEGPQLATYFAQLAQMGIFEKVSGILLGTFIRYEEKARSQSVYDLIRPYLPQGMPVAKTDEIGHRPDSKAVIIGKRLKL